MAPLPLSPVLGRLCYNFGPGKFRCSSLFDHRPGIVPAIPCGMIYSKRLLLPARLGGLDRELARKGVRGRIRAPALCNRQTNDRQKNPRSGGGPSDNPQTLSRQFRPRSGPAAFCGLFRQKGGGVAYLSRHSKSSQKFTRQGRPMSAFMLHSVPLETLTVMAYSEAARELRRCKGTRKDGEPCRLFAAWGDPAGLCGPHGGRKRGGAPLCECIAYQWPHRPGGGLCCWPDPPRFRSLIPVGTHTLGRLKHGGHQFGTLARALRRCYGREWE